MNLWTRLKYFFYFLKSVFSLNIHLIKGMWRLSKIPQPSATIFGGSRIEIDQEVAQQASLLAKKLAELGFSIITGGGPGIMEAANFGALQYVQECQAGGDKECRVIVSGAVGLLHLNKERVNPYVQTSIIMDHFFSRKWLLVRYSSAFVFFPGGFGTMDEFFEVVTLVQTKKMPNYPVILIGSNYWSPIIDWIKNHALKENLIEFDDQKIFKVVDDVHVAIEEIKKYHSL